MNKDEKQFNQELNLAIGNCQERFAEGILQHFSAFEDLIDISKSKVNPDYAATNLQQQSGFSAEIKQVARENASNIIDGNQHRVARTDDIGKVNHPQFDIVDVDSNGRPIVDANGNFTGGGQQKNFSKIENYDKLVGKEFQHYKDAKLIVPNDHYDGIVSRWEDKISSLEKQKEYLKKSGNTEQVKIIEKQIENIKDAKGRLVKGDVSSKDAMEARLNPTISTLKDTFKIAHKAGVDSAKYGAAIGGGVSVVRSVYAVTNGEKDIFEASWDVVKDTGKAAASSYATGAASAVLGGALKNTNKQILQNLAKKNGPTAIISTATILTKQISLLVSGKISGEKFVKNIGQEGSSLATSIAGSNLGAIIGTALLPGIGTLIGGFVGGMVSSMLSGALYNELMNSVLKTEMSEKRRKYYESLAQLIIAEEQKYRNEMLEICDQFFNEKENAIKSAFLKISEDLHNGQSIDLGLKNLANAFDLQLKFSSPDDLGNFLRQNKTLRI